MAEKTVAELLDESTDDSRIMDAPLSERLKAVADEVERRSPEFAAVVARTVARLEANNVGQSAPQIGERMPDFILPDEKGTLVCLKNLLEQGPVVVSFHRGHWCPYCRLNADGLARIAPDVKRLGAQIVAISPETHQYGAELKAHANAPFPVLADVDNGYAQNSISCSGSTTRSARRCRRVASTSRPIRATKPGCCRSPRPSLSAGMASSRRVTSIPITVAEWNSTRSSRRLVVWQKFDPHRFQNRKAECKGAPIGGTQRPEGRS